uniref:ISXO2-like transposase domain-containing protein n=1 Tax=Panagrolaimus davidi TaxID=227884 RepID=A0A914QR49_9BILA
MDSGRNCVAGGCSGHMNFRQREEKGSTFICTKKQCRKEVGFRKDTFFEGSHLTIKEIFEFVYYWCNGTCQVDYVLRNFVREDGSSISRQAIVDWRQFCRDVAVSHFQKNPTMIGGEGKTVEIDETVITKRKYNRGRLVNQNYWFFGGVERESGEVFLVHVERRDALTLLPIIQRYIRPGTTIISDLWRAYGGISRLPEGYNHYTVNHSQNFVDPETGAHTNKIESEWQKFKMRHKAEYGTSRTLLVEYVAQYLWKKKFKGADEFYNFWCQVLEDYPLEF